MKTYRKRFMASTLALLMTVSIPLTALAEGNEGTDNDGLEISQELNGQPVSEPTPALTDPATPSPGEVDKAKVDKAKAALDEAIKAAKTFRGTEEYNNGKAEYKTAFENALSAAEAAKNVAEATVESLDQAKTNLVNAQENLKNAQQKEADKFIPQTKTLEVVKGDTVDITAGLKNTPVGANVAVKTPVDTSIVGIQTGVITVTFSDSSTKKVDITVNVKESTPILKKLVISSESVNSSGIVSGYVKAGGVAVKGATVTFYTNSGTVVRSRTTDDNGYFSFYVGTEYYNYYYDGYYKGHKVYYDSTYGYYYRNSNNYRVYINDYYWYGNDYRCGNSGYLLASLTDYETSEKAYVTGTCSGDYYYYPSYKYEYNYSDYRVYPTSISRTTSYVKGYLPNEKGKTVSVYSNDYYYDGYYSDGYYDSYGSWHYYNYYNGYYNRYYRNSNYYLGSATVDSDGYFTIYFNRSVPTSESLYYYVDGYKDGRYATAPSVSQAEAGTMFIKGKAGSFASIRVEDANGTKIGTTTANGDGEFACYLDRKLSLGETIKVIASESSKYDSQTTYKVVDTSLSGQTYARVSYIKGYPDGTFKPSNNVTRAEAAQMFATLLNSGTSFGTSSVTKFTDANNKWYSPAVNYIAGKGLLSGYSDGTFKPDADITRAEFAQMISGYLKAGYAGSANFKDVKGHWASDAIDKVFGNKAVEGYPDGTFKPNKTLTRAEAVTVLNAVFNRYTTSSSLNNVSSANLKNYSDISSSHWAYYQILDASNAHVSQKVTSTSNEEVWK